MEQPRHIVFVTGTRADFGKMKSLMLAVEADPAFRCSIFATGMHLLKKYGDTIKEIYKTGFQNVFPCFNQSAPLSKCMDIVLSETIKGLSFYLTENRPDLLVVHGDRVETLAGAIVGALQGFRTAHIEGGERSGTVDELIRHSVTKLAHIHFTATDENRKRLLQLGESERNIFVIGSPDIDIMLRKDLPNLQDVLAYYEIPFRDYCLFIYHPVVTELDKQEHNINEIIEALKLSDKNFVMIYPNNDSGSEVILKKLLKLKDNKHFRIFPSVRFESFLTLIRNAQCVIGNSSCGIHEAPVYGTPTLNIGSRQRDRFQYKTIYNIPEDRQAILNFLQNLPGHCEPMLAYGSGNSSELFMNELRKDNIWNAPLQKKFYDRI